MTRLLTLLLVTTFLTPIALSLPTLQAQPRPQRDFEALPFNPRRTVVYRTTTRLTIDSKLDEPVWRAAEPVHLRQDGRRWITRPESLAAARPR